MRVAVIGGTGFIGGYLVAALLDGGHEVAVLVRPGSEARLARAGECAVIAGDLADEAALAATLESADAVIYNVGLLREFPARGITFEATHHEGVVRTIAAAKAGGCARFLLMSANGVKSPGTPYQATKHRGERALAESGLDYTIFRPSVVFGDPQGKMEFATQLYRDMVRPPLPAIGFHTGWRPSRGAIRMSPVHVEDVAAAFVAALATPATIGRSYAIGGPEILSWTDMLRRIAEAAGKRKLILPMPIAVMRLAATLLDWLPLFPVTRDQLIMLAEGNTADAKTVAELIGHAPRPFSAANLAYLRRPG